MPILNDNLNVILKQKIQYINKLTQVVTSNITESEMKNARLKELAPFESILRRSRNAKTSNGTPYKDVKDFKIEASDVITTNQEISREMEMLKITKASIDHDGIVNIMKAFHRMYKTIIQSK